MFGCQKILVSAPVIGKGVLSGIESGETDTLWRHKRILDLMPLIQLALLVHVG